MSAPTTDEPDFGPRQGVHRGQAVTGVLWTVLQRWFVRVTTLLTFVVLGRLLSPRDFGIVALAGVFVGVVSVFAEVGLSTYVVQAQVLAQRTISTVFWTGLALSTGLAVSLAALAPVIAELVDAAELGGPLRALSLVIVLASLSSTQSALLKRRLEFRVLAVRSMVATLASCAVALALALNDAGVWALVAQALSFSAVSVIVLWSGGGWRPSWSFDLSVVRTVASYGVSILAIQLVSQLRQRADALVIGVIAGPVVLGFYTVASRIIGVLLDTAVSVISTVANPVFARLKGEPERLQRAYVSSVSTSLAVVAPLLATTAVLSPLAIPLIFGPKWEPSIPVAQLLTVSGLVTTMTYFDRGLLIALDRRRTELMLGLSTTVVGICLIAAVAPFGLVAIALAAATRALAIWPLRLRTSSRALGMSAFGHGWRLFRIVLAASVAAAPMALSEQMVDGTGRQTLVLLAGISSMVVLYPCLLRLLAPSVAKEMKAVVHSSLRKRRPPRTRDAPGVEADTCV